MNRKIVIVLVAGLFFLAGCGKIAETGDNQIETTAQSEDTADDSAVDEDMDALLQQLLEEELANDAGLQQQDTDSEKPQMSDVDVDLTKLSSTMVYETVYYMLIAPDEYIGETIRIRGIYYNSVDETTNQVYHFIVVSDEDGDDQCGLEFLLGDDSLSYPAYGSQIEVTGILDTYDELGQPYCYLNVDTME